MAEPVKKYWFIYGDKYDGQGRRLLYRLNYSEIPEDQINKVVEDLKYEQDIGNIEIVMVIDE